MAWDCWLVVCTALSPHAHRGTSTPDRNCRSSVDERTNSCWPWPPRLSLLASRGDRMASVCLVWYLLGSWFHTSAEAAKRIFYENHGWLTNLPSWSLESVYWPVGMLASAPSWQHELSTKALENMESIPIYLGSQLALSGRWEKSLVFFPTPSWCLVHIDTGHSTSGGMVNGIWPWAREFGVSKNRGPVDREQIFLWNIMINEKPLVFSFSTIQMVIFWILRHLF